MIYYSYECVGQKLFEALVNRLALGQSAVMLGHSFGGKRYTVRKVHAMLRERQDAGFVVSLPLYESLQNPGALAGIVAQQLGIGPAGDMFDVLDRFFNDQKRTVTLLIPNLDLLSHSMIRRILQGIRPRVEAGLLTVLVGGNERFNDFVHGPNSEFNCGYHYVLQGYDRPEFNVLAQQFAALYTFRVEPDAIDAFWERTGGQGYLLEALLHRTAELRARGVVQAGPLSGSEAARTLEMVALGSTSWWSMFAAAASALRDERFVWPQIEQLLDPAGDPVAAPLEPGPLEMTGIAIRSSGELHFSSPLVREFTKHHFTPRRLADLYAISGDWAEAFERYQSLEHELWIRPDSAADRPELADVLRALAGYMASLEDAGEVWEVFRKASRFLLGFGELNWWHWTDKGWCVDRKRSSGFPRNREYDFAQSLPASREGRTALLDLPGDWPRIAVVARVESRGNMTTDILSLSDVALDRSISRDRLELARYAVKAFLSAFDHAGRIVFQTRQLEMKDHHFNILDSILESMNVVELDSLTICRQVAQKLRSLDYRRVLLCLLDPSRDRIVGVWDESDQPEVDVARMTNYLLTCTTDLQPRVIRSRMPAVVADAAEEPLANKEVVRAARQRGLAIVPILESDNVALGTIHVEREDGEAPSPQEVADLLRFGRRLANVLNHAEHATHISRALDRVSDPVAIIDPSKRWRYGNAAAEKLLGIPAGWRKWSASKHMAEGHMLARYIDRSLVSGEGSTDQLGAGPLREGNDSFHVNSAPLRDALRNITGVSVTLRDVTRVQQLVDEVGGIMRTGRELPALQASLDAMSKMGYPARLYLIQHVAGEQRFVSKLAVGMKPSDLDAFNAGKFILVPFSKEHHTWQCVVHKEGQVFVWRPEGLEGSIEFTGSGLQARVVSSPEYEKDLGKQPGDFWIDLPLFDSRGNPMGKLATNIAGQLGSQEFWVLQILAALVAVIVETFRSHEQEEKEREKWKQDGYLRSLATISHHLRNRVITLDTLHWRFQQAQADLDSLPEVTRDFGDKVKTITSTITRCRDFLLPPHVKPADFDLRSTVERVLLGHFRHSTVGFRLISNEEAVPVRADEELLKIAMSEILDNARKALRNKAGGEVTVELRSGAPKVIVILFADNGPGIPVENRERVFEEFFSSWGGNKERSTGLGLGWTRRVFLAHGGDLRVDSSRSGAVFRATLPLEAEGIK